jgi:hypothetical protein
VSSVKMDKESQLLPAKAGSLEKRVKLA